MFQNIFNINNKNAIKCLNNISEWLYRIQLRKNAKKFCEIPNYSLLYTEKRISMYTTDWNKNANASSTGSYLIDETPLVGIPQAAGFVSAYYFNKINVKIRNFRRQINANTVGTYARFSFYDKFVNNVYVNVMSESGWAYLLKRRI